MLHYFSPVLGECDIPKLFPSPFNNHPHIVARQAAVQLQLLLTNKVSWQHDFETAAGGKMFGVLVVKNNAGQIGFLAAFSGMLAGQWELPGFVPPLFDQNDRDTFLPAGEAKLKYFSRQLSILQQSLERKSLQMQLKNLADKCHFEFQSLQDKHKKNKQQRHQQRASIAEDKVEHEKLYARLSLESQNDKRERRELLAKWAARRIPVEAELADIDQQIFSLRKERAKLSSELHAQVFATYTLCNQSGKQKSITQFFDGQPPGGAGDCAAPKLFQYAYQQNLHPIALAEFWWGAPPPDGVRHHGYFYPACRSKCGPILPFMLDGLALEPPQVLGNNVHDDSAPTTIYEDADLVVVNKPCGLLSVPGKAVKDSVLTRLQNRYPQASGALLVHRLDLSTSGLLLAAKNAHTHKALQQQFEQRSIEKRYLAVLAARLSENKEQGSIELPLRVDIEDRPRQRVCYEHGKSAITKWQVLERQQDTTRVYFYPLSGRTHQLRVHAAYHEGLNAPIVGDELYGNGIGRLMLHAERLRFTQPNTGERIEVHAPAPF